MNAKHVRAARSQKRSQRYRRREPITDLVLNRSVCPEKIYGKRQPRGVGHHARSRSSCASNSRLCSSVFPKPIPGSNAMAMGSIPHSRARSYCCRKKSATSETTSSYCGAICIVCGCSLHMHNDESRFVFGNQRHHLLVASSSRDVVHNRSSRSIAARATSAFAVSIEMMTVALSRAIVRSPESRVSILPLRRQVRRRVASIRHQHR